MAVAMIPPHMAAAMNRAKAERDAMNSTDPVIRYRAKERAANRAFMEISAAMVQQAKANAKAAEQQEREAQRFEQEYNRNKYNY